MRHWDRIIRRIRYAGLLNHDGQWEEYVVKSHRKLIFCITLMTLQGSGTFFKFEFFQCDH